MMCTTLAAQHLLSLLVSVSHGGLKCEVARKYRRPFHRFGALLLRQ